jgi:hypothetical protein
MTPDMGFGDFHRGVKIHAGQSRERIERVVKPEIDAVLAMGDAAALAGFAADCANAPEARLLTAAKVEAAFALAAEGRENRPRGVDLERVAASVAGLASVGWRSPTHYASDLDVHTERAVPREVPLPPVPR